MATMICSICGRAGIYWKNLTAIFGAYTYCPNCGGTNCQRPEPLYPDADEMEDIEKGEK